VDPAVPHAGDEVRFTATATFTDRECCLNSFLFGDGATTGDPTSRCANDTPGPATSVFTHVYNKPGRWEFSFQGMAGRCGDHNVYGALYAYLEVSAGSSRGQGPSLPTIDALEARAPGDPVVPGFLKVWAKARDEDGFVHHFVIDFGDGTPPETRPGDPYGCRPMPSGWPAPSDASIQAPYPSHQYATPGSFTITVTVVSTACSGLEEQHASATIPYVW